MKQTLSAVPCTPLALLSLGKPGSAVLHIHLRTPLLPLGHLLSLLVTLGVAPPAHAHVAEARHWLVGVLLQLPDLLLLYETRKKKTF